MTRLPLSTFAIAFGLLGYAVCWSAAVSALGWAGWLPQVFWVAAAAALGWLLVAHAVRGRRSSATLLSQLELPAQGPLAAVVPVAATLFGADLHLVLPLAGTVLVGAGVVVATLFAGWLLAFWIRNGVPLDSIHGGFFLPTVAAGFVAAEAAAQVGNTVLAMAAFGVGAFFSVVVFTAVLARLALGPRLVEPLVPTLAILAAPPAVGGLAWFAMNGMREDGVSDAFLGMSVLMLLVQVALLPTYRLLRFSLAFWSFSFPFTAVVTQFIVWSSIARYPLWQLVVIVLLAAVTVALAVLATKSLLLRRVGRSRYERKDRPAAADRPAARTPVAARTSEEALR